MKKGKVLLITPNLKGIEDGVNRIQPSLGFLLIAPILEKNGFDVKIHDSALAGWENRKTLDAKMDYISIHWHFKFKGLENWREVRKKLIEEAQEKRNNLM